MKEDSSWNNQHLADVQRPIRIQLPILLTLFVQMLYLSWLWEFVYPYLAFQNLTFLFGRRWFLKESANKDFLERREFLTIRTVHQCPFHRSKEGFSSFCWRGFESALIEPFSVMAQNCVDIQVSICTIHSTRWVKRLYPESGQKAENMKSEPYLGVCLCRRVRVSNELNLTQHCE